MARTFLVCAVLAAALLVCGTASTNVLFDPPQKVGSEGGGKCASVVAWAMGHYRDYPGMCLEMVKLAWASVGVTGVDYLDQASAHAAVPVAQGHPGWHAWNGGNPPPGAVVLFSECGNQPFGHACISKGTGCINNDNAGYLAWAYMEQHWCGHSPAGWILPAAC